MDNINNSVNTFYMQNVYQEIKCSKRPIIIWGTLIAGKIAYRLLQQMTVPVVAFGDNNLYLHGKKMYNIEIISAQIAKEKYPNAIIVLGSFFENIEFEITKQLRLLSNQFKFISFKFVEYFYELEVMQRKIYDKSNFFDVLEEVAINEVQPWRKHINRKSIFEYRYKVEDFECEDLMNVLAQGYNIKNLGLIVAVDKLADQFLDLISIINKYNNVGHIILYLSNNLTVENYLWEEIKRNCFYVCIDEDVIQHKEFMNKLEQNEIIYEIKAFPVKKMEDKICLNNQPITETLISNVLHNYIGVNCNRVFDDKKRIYIVQLFNGLANQMLMYLFGRFLEEFADVKVVFDDTIYALDVRDREQNLCRINKWLNRVTIEEVEAFVGETRKRNSFYYFFRPEVAEVFDLPICLLSDYLEENEWSLYLDKVKKDFMGNYAQAFPLGQLLLKYGINVDIMQDGQMPNQIYNVKNFYRFNTHILEVPFNKASITNYILNNKRNTYYMGVWTTGEVKDWLFTNRKWIRTIFQFDLNLDMKNKKYLNEITNSDGVILHIRRGDFVSLNLAADTMYLTKSIQAVQQLKEYKNKKYFVFSDDLTWCKEHKQELGLDTVESQLTFVEGNSGEKSCIDMYLMSNGKIFIPTSGSSFSYMALLLSTTMELCADAIKYKFDTVYAENIKINLVNIKEC